MATLTWVRARALAAYLLVFQGTMAVGSFAWGALAERFGNGTVPSTCRPLFTGPIPCWRSLLIRRMGALLITVEYRVSDERASDFLEAMDEMRIFRRREGAVNRDLFRDLVDPDRYLETFVVVSWAEHMHEHARVTMED